MYKDGEDLLNLVKHALEHNPELVTKDLLEMTLYGEIRDRRTTVVHELARKNAVPTWIWDKYPLLRQFMANVGEDYLKVVDVIILEGILPKRKINRDLLSESSFKSLNYVRARCHCLPKRRLTIEILKEKGLKGDTVAHVLAREGNLPEKFFVPEILTLEDNAGETVAHILAYRDRLPEECLTTDLLKMKTDRERWSVAHVLAWHKRLPERFFTREILNLTDKSGETVAHELAGRGLLPERYLTKRLLLRKDRSGWAVAHALAKRGMLPEKYITKDLLLMETKHGMNLLTILLENKSLPDNLVTEEILQQGNYFGMDDECYPSELYMMDKGILPARFWTKERFRYYCYDLMDAMSRKKDAEIRAFAEEMPFETLEEIVKSERLREYMDKPETKVLIDAAKAIINRTVENAAFEDMPDEGVDNEDLYGGCQ